MSLPGAQKNHSGFVVCSFFCVLRHDMACGCPWLVTAATHMIEWLYAATSLKIVYSNVFT